MNASAFLTELHTAENWSLHAKQAETGPGVS